MAPSAPEAVDVFSFGVGWKVMFQASLAPNHTPPPAMWLPSSFILDTEQHRTSISAGGALAGASRWAGMG